MNGVWSFVRGKLRFGAREPLPEPSLILVERPTGDDFFGDDTAECVVLKGAPPERGMVYVPRVAKKRDGVLGFHVTRAEWKGWAVGRNRESYTIRYRLIYASPMGPL